ncbi:putative leucyl-tRNA synthetase, mitochondrial [Papilio machaon]|uniref:leucine--tRNA ligase n=1 Tax=Papilio machaon TaxID=76193 RepID=A0A194RHC1_PAPMA|nr:putative leucyl-tRNA synthetase, mitochondrial [Papilio machaon]
MRIPGCVLNFRRGSFKIFKRFNGGLGLWNEDISTEIKLKIEKHWCKNVQSKNRKVNDTPYYVLPMFPYPSGNLHMGHVRVYSISDTIAKFHQMNGKNVLHPIGWDAFGLPAENAALERNIPPQNWTKTNISTMKEQLFDLGFNFDWDKEINTCDPSYYKWTQYIFLKLFENGLAYQSKAKVNWDPVDKTVLADEQVDDNGCSWRSGAKVEKKVLTQWFIRTTKYAKQLYDGLNSKSLENWKDIINLQKHWIGECNGISVTFQVKVGDIVKSFDVWTSEPYKLIHGEFLTMQKDNIILDEYLKDKSLSTKCINPITNCEIPIYITDNVNYPEGQEVYLACPSVDVEDRKISQDLGISFEQATGNINIDNENQKAIDIALSLNVGGHFVSSKLKDWLISRQRFWGTPIPIIYCSQCGIVPVPYNDLPITLPDIESLEFGPPSLKNMKDWMTCKCPKCSGTATRETDTMDTFVDSSWYFYRFLDHDNTTMPFSKEKIKDFTPVHCYIGGKEHAVLHLYYARFMSYFLHSLGWTMEPEPFKKLLVQGMVMGQSYKIKASGKYIPPEDVEKVGKEYKEKSTGEPVLVQWEKMSKSKYNGEKPKRLLTSYGCDTTRLLMLADVPPATSRRWSDATLPGVLNWQHRLWITIRDFMKHRNNPDLIKENYMSKEMEDLDTKIWNARNYFNATATYHFKYTQKLSVGISRLQSLTNVLRNNIPPEVIANSKEYELALAALIIMLTPVTPHFCSELWAGFLSTPNRINNNSVIIDWQKSVLEQQWPQVDNNFELSFLCKVDGADRCDLKIRADELSKINQERALQIMLEQEPVAKRIARGIVNTKYELFPNCRAILYGLILSEKSKIKQPTFQATRNVFGNDTDSDDEPKKKLVLLRPSDNINRQSKISQEKAINEDPTVYQYDEIYDSMISKKEEKKEKSKEQKKPKYIENLMKAANKRKIENERRLERQIQKEREKEGDEFADKEVFVTSAYKQKLEELRKEEEKEKYEEYLESIGDVTKQKDLGGFYRHLYEQKLGTDKPENKDQKIQSSDERLKLKNPKRPAILIKHK